METSWSNEHDGWLLREEAEHALALAKEHAPDAEAVLLGYHKDDGVWDEDVDGDDVDAWQVTDGSGSCLLVPIAAQYDNDDDLDVPCPPGFVWVVI